MNNLSGAGFELWCSWVARITGMNHQLLAPTGVKWRQGGDEGFPSCGSADQSEKMKPYQASQLPGAELLEDSQPQVYQAPWALPNMNRVYAYIMAI
jgi:hypothetical protein